MAGLRPAVVLPLQRQAAVAREWARHRHAAGGRRRPREQHPPGSAIGHARTVYELWRAVGETQKITPAEAEAVLRTQLRHGLYPHAPVFPWYQSLVRSHRATALAMQPGVLLELLVRGGRVQLVGNLLASRTLTPSMMRVTEATLLTVAQAAKDQSPGPKVLARLGRQVYFVTQRSGLLWRASQKFLFLLNDVLAGGDPALRRAVSALLNNLSQVAARPVRRGGTGPMGPAAAAPSLAEQAVLAARGGDPHEHTQSPQVTIAHVLDRLVLPAQEDTGLHPLQLTTIDEAAATEVEGTSAASLAAVLVRDLPRDINRTPRLLKLAKQYTAQVRQIRSFSRPDIVLKEFIQPDFAIVHLANGNDALRFIHAVDNTNPFKHSRPVRLAYLRARKKHRIRRYPRFINRTREGMETLVWDPI